jgi:hypothetical protein
MLSHLSVRLLIVSGAFLPWLMLYLIAERWVVVRKAAPWLKWIGFALLALSIISFASDYTHLSRILSMYFWGLWGATNWLQNRYKLSPPAQPAVTSLNISGHEPTSSLR